MKSIVKMNTLSIIIVLTITFILIYITNKYILTVNFYDNSGDFMAGLPSEEGAVYESLQKWIYISSAVYLLIKFALTSLVLYMGLYLADHETSYSKIFNVVVLSEMIFFFPAVVKILWFCFLQPGGTLSDWHTFYPLSMINLCRGVHADWYYALQTLNLFEIIYWFLLSYGIYKLSGLSFDSSLKIVITSYVPALLIWIAVVTFCSLLLFPNTA